MRIATLVLLSLLYISCNNKEDKAIETVDKSINQPSRSLSTLKNLVLTKGDADAYYELQMAYLDNEYPEEFLVYAMTMANKFDYPQAYFDVYSCLKNEFHSDMTKIDDSTANLAIDYLLRASEKGHEQAQEIVKEYSITNAIMDRKAFSRCK